MVNKSKASLRGLRTFCVAARLLSFRSAAEELFITSSAVSHQIKKLERELDQPLFDRNSRELVLTETGKSLYEDVSPLIEQLDEITARYKKQVHRDSLRISVQPFFASEYFIPRMAEFTAQHPEIDIQVGTSDETSEKHPSNAELSIRLFKSPPTDMDSFLLFPLRLAPAGSAKFSDEIKIKKRVIVSEFPLIVHDSQAKAWAQWSASAGIQLPRNSKITRLDSMIAVVRAAERGIGAALVPVPIGDQWFQEGTLTRLFKEDLVADVSYYLVCEKGRSSEKSVRVLRDWILANFSETG